MVNYILIYDFSYVVNFTQDRLIDVFEYKQLPPKVINPSSWTVFCAARFLNKSKNRTDFEEIRIRNPFIGCVFVPIRDSHLNALNVTHTSSSTNADTNYHVHIHKKHQHV